MQLQMERGIFLVLMIPCERNCSNQRDGCCCLEGITCVTNPRDRTEKGCLYFVPAGKGKEDSQFPGCPQSKAYPAT